ncbi:GntR family transcriptional regulator [Pseudomonas asiatica]|uniref:FadR/GntR family transcriptional regulator n=1 Tax=Pseudomonas asiatica TaxID=2219225 RepID=UPI002E7BA0DE|nr:GntR family transcriptional regulator [Pseudomonas asiatica]MEE1916296.1 GntR family transcriptional regulator [Pseudomonas asiatica]
MSEMNDLQLRATRGVERRQVLHIPKAPQIVAARIKKQIVRGELKEGDTLQAEGRLMEEFGVSRPTIREAFRILEAEHLITVARGAKGGAIVHAPDPQLIASYALMVLQFEGTTVAEVYQARMAFEPSAVRFVVEHAAQQAPALLREVLEQQRECFEDPVVFAAEVARFHRLLVELSGNKPLIHLWGAMHEVIERHQAAVVALQRRNVSLEGARLAAVAGLKSQDKLIQLIEEREIDMAEAHWRKHMVRANKVWVTGYEHMLISELFQEF